MIREYKAGDLVKLKSGGPAMTVMDITNDGKVKTKHFVGQDEVFYGVFDPECLDRHLDIEPEDILKMISMLNNYFISEGLMAYSTLDVNMIKRYASKYL